MIINCQKEKLAKDIKDDRRNRNDERRGGRVRQDDEDVQRAIEGLKDIPDDELQEFLDDEDFNIVDAWEGDEEQREDGTHRSERGREGRRQSSDHEAPCRDRYRRRRGGSSHRDNRERSRRDERRGREEGMRRDPSKSSKDIERDKMRTKRDNDSKILAEKEKAIKHLLDSDTVVPPGTEEEAIESERILDRSPRKSREHRRTPPERRRVTPPRRRSHERIRHSPPHRERSPFNPERRRSIERRRSSERIRRASWDRRHSAERRDRRVTPERVRRRVEERLAARRSRSRDRHRSRSFDRLKRRASRSPGRRGSPRRRSLSKSPDRRRKRSPFINEIARQFRDEALRGTSVGQFLPQTGGLLPTPVHQPVPPPAQQHYMPMMDPAMALPPQPQGHFISTFEPMSFEPVPPMHPPQPHEYNAPPVLYNQPSFVPLPVPSPQPVPAPILDQPHYNPVPAPLPRSPSPKRTKFSENDRYDYRERNRGLSQNGGSGQHSRPERLKTPEPPVISDSKPFEKTSLSSLLEASVSAKDSGYPVLYPGYKPEILRKCDMALRELPDEDPRLKMTGRFFFDPDKPEPRRRQEEFHSNSILVQRTRNVIVWEDEPSLSPPPPPSNQQEIIIHLPKMMDSWTQTNELIVEDNGTQTINEMHDFCVQVCPGELDPPREEKRTIMDRLDWGARETSDYSPARNTEDLRWSLNNSRYRGSPSRESRGHSRERSHHERDSRGFDLSPMRSRESFSGRNPSFNSRERYSPNYRNSRDRQEDFRDSRSQENSPEINEEDEDDVEIVEESFPSWRGRNKFAGSSKPRGRGKSSGRSYRGRGGGFRGKF